MKPPLFLGQVPCKQGISNSKCGWTMTNSRHMGLSENEEDLYMAILVGGFNPPEKY
jgi:hypothetical protein